VGGGKNDEPKGKNETKAPARLDAAEQTAGRDAAAEAAAARGDRVRLLPARLLAALGLGEQKRAKRARASDRTRASERSNARERAIERARESDRTARAASKKIGARRRAPRSSVDGPTRGWAAVAPRRREEDDDIQTRSLSFFSSSFSTPFFCFFLVPPPPSPLSAL
jgi:hypothetical protein